MAWGIWNPRYWPGRLGERQGDTEDRVGAVGVIEEAKALPSTPLRSATPRSSELLGNSAVGGGKVEPTAAVRAPPDVPIDTGADDMTCGPPGGGGGCGGGGGGGGGGP